MCWNWDCEASDKAEHTGLNCACTCTEIAIYCGRCHLGCNYRELTEDNSPRCKIDRLRHHQYKFYWLLCICQLCAYALLWLLSWRDAAVFSLAAVLLLFCCHSQTLPLAAMTLPLAVQLLASVLRASLSIPWDQGIGQIVEVALLVLLSSAAFGFALRAGFYHQRIREAARKHSRDHDTVIAAAAAADVEAAVAEVDVEAKVARLPAHALATAPSTGRSGSAEPSHGHGNNLSSSNNTSRPPQQPSLASKSDPSAKPDQSYKRIQKPDSTDEPDTRASHESNSTRNGLQSIVIQGVPANPVILQPTTTNATKSSAAALAPASVPSIKPTSSLLITESDLRRHVSAAWPSQPTNSSSSSLPVSKQQQRFRQGRRD